MRKLIRQTVLILVPAATFVLQGCTRDTNEVERPEKIQSKREVIYDSVTYAKLAHLWEKYNAAYPSEDAYANWMYATRYSSLPDYGTMLEEGVKKYPANPTLLYLSGLLKGGGRNSAEGRQLLERATILDPNFLDPWFALVVQYMAQGDGENTNVALRHLLEGRAIEDGVMDYSFNMLASLEAGAILITNGDNDTYPGWILTRLLQIRPDVQIVNRSLLNTDWYPSWIMNAGVPTFISQTNLDSLRKQLMAAAAPVPPGGVFGDTLIVRIIDAAERTHRPVYFSSTMDFTPVVQRYTATGRSLGLVTLVTPSEQPPRVLLRQLFTTWLHDYRTGGLDSWRLRYSPKASAGRYLIINYGASLGSLMDQIISTVPEFRLPLFRWYRAHVADALPRDAADQVNRIWCRADSPAEIRDWCRTQGYKE